MTGARSFGAATSGAASDELSVLLADTEEGRTWLDYSDSYTTLGDGTVIEWNGIAPDVAVTFTGADTDEVLDAAIAWLRTQ